MQKKRKEALAYREGFFCLLALFLNVYYSCCFISFMGRKY
jgi:hypothetical protein